MKITQKINPSVIQAAVAMLTPYIPEISPSGLLEALKEYKADPTPPIHQKPYTRQEVADLLGLSIMTINRMMNSGTLRRIKVGLRSVRIDPASVQNLLENSPQY